MDLHRIRESMTDKPSKKEINFEEDFDEEGRAALEAFEAKLKKEFQDEYSDLIHSELGELEKISSMLGSVSVKLKQLYQSKFPKKCNTCGRVYESRQAYINATKVLKKDNTVIYDKFGLQEYRNCVCGSTLMILTDDRRDTTEFGVARRKLFDSCLEKMLALSNKSEAELIEELRKVFRTIIDEVNGKDDKGNKSA